MQIIVFILIILLIPSVYFSARFFLLSKNIKGATNDFKEISENIEANRKLTFAYPNKEFENLLKEINEYLGKTQADKIRYIKREEEIRKEIENISHDLRTPLTSILGYLELMRDETSTNEEKEEYISIIERKSKGLQNLIQSFYDLSRLESKEYKMKMEVVDIHKELREQLLEFYNEFDKNGINVELDIGEEPISILGDINALERIFTNLIQNAIKYSETKFNVSLRKKDEEVIIIFANDTKGLHEYELEKLFKRFYMKDASRNNQSSGLGLTITNLLIQAMGGEIQAEVDKEWIRFKVKFMIK
ncbi:sensor histidine kinase [[Clostridium] dakarense]|uniref:sensor histidine kinase n=1 Tax=Faecalimicrobium dakarense TaxID=1301100 RepID=UPI0004B0414D|nr:HAMP domain-containing sensor histidine kinase [[Clostridium] dakarense]